MPVRHRLTRLTAALGAVLISCGATTPAGAHANPVATRPVATRPVAPSPVAPSPVAPSPVTATGKAAAPVGGPLLGSPSVVVKPAAGAPPLPVPSVSAFVVADLDTGEILAAKAPHTQMSPASTIKILTAYTLLPRLDPKTTYVGTRADENVEGTRVGIVTGQRYRLNELWYGLLLTSGNDAAHALATMAGGVPATLRLMQDEARRLQANDTLATTPSGLENDNGPGPFSSAYDLALITRAAYHNNDFRAYVSAKKARFPGKGQAGFQISNQNRLLWGYSGAIGVKTGYTHRARNTFVGAASRNGHTLVVTLLRGGRGIQNDAEELLDWGFAAHQRTTPVGKLVDPLPDLSSATPTVSPGGSASSAGSGSTTTNGSNDLSAGGDSTGGNDAGWGGMRKPLLLAAGGLAFLLLAVRVLRVRARRRSRRRRRAR